MSTKANKKSRNPTYDAGMRSIARAGILTAGEYAGFKAGDELEIVPTDDEIRQTFFFSMKPGNQVAGMSADGTRFGLQIISPSQAIDNERLLDQQMASLDHDFKINSTPATLNVVQQWNAFHMAWVTYFSEHTTLLQVLASTPAAVWNETEKYRGQLRTWLDTYKKTFPDKPPTLGNVPDPPSGGLIGPPEPPPSKPFFSTTTIIILTALGIGAAALGIYMTYRYVQNAHRQVRRAEDMLPQLLAARTGGASNIVHAALPAHHED